MVEKSCKNCANETQSRMGYDKILPEKHPCVGCVTTVLRNWKPRPSMVVRFETLDRTPKTKRETTTGKGNAEVIAATSEREDICPGCGADNEHGWQWLEMRYNGWIRCLRCWRIWLP